jgi:predicted Zn-dependent protease
MFGPGLTPKLKKTHTTDSVWMELATETLNRALALRPDDAQLRITVAERLKLVNTELALRYAQEAVEHSPDDPDALILLGMIQALNEQDREAKDTLRRASKLARQQGKHDIVEQANAIRQQVGSPFLRMSIQMAEAFDGFDIDDIDPEFDLFP